jgi:Glycosyl transferase family 2
MKIFGVALVRSEADIIAVSLRYHLQLGLDGVFVLDNASSDGTDKILERLAQADDRIRWSRHEGEFQQAELTTGLAREAARAGADWIVPFDADEFWYAPCRTFREVLASSKAGALRAQVIHYIQAREQSKRSPEGLLTMTRRASWTTGPPDARALVETQKIGYVEAMYLPKWISRASLDLEIGAGNHSAGNVTGKPETTAELVCLHAPLRSRDTLVQKAAQSRRLEAARRPTADGWHTHRVRRLLEEDSIDAEWAANSYKDDALDVYGRRRSVVFDPTLRDAVAPFLMKASAALTDRETSQMQAGRSEWQREIVRNFLTNLHDDALSRTKWAVGLDEELERARAVIASLEARVLDRTGWAQSLEKELAEKRDLIADLEMRIAERTTWAQTADTETERARAALSDLRKEFEERTAWALQLERELEESRAVVSAFYSSTPWTLSSQR